MMETEVLGVKPSSIAIKNLQIKWKKLFWQSDKIAKAYIKNKQASCFEKSDKTFQGKWKPVAQSCTQYNCQFEPIQVTILFFKLSYPGGEITTNSHVLKVSIMYKYIYDFDPSFRGFNSPLNWLYPYFRLIQ